MSVYGFLSTPFYMYLQIYFVLDSTFHQEQLIIWAKDFITSLH